MVSVSSALKNANSDKIFRSATQYLSKFFTHGWGDLETYRTLAYLQRLVWNDKKLSGIHKFLQTVDVKLSKGKDLNSCMTIYKGEFKSPLASLAPKLLPAESQTAHFQLVLPKNWDSQKPICIHLAGTGDHFFWRRRHFMATPLAKDYNIGSIILENPFYGYRKPKNQMRSAVNHVSDIFVMGAALMVECATLLFWCERNGYGPLGITGISMGGHMATIAASGWRKPIAIVPCLSWTSAAPAFTEGVLSQAVRWEVLEKQLETTPGYKDILRKDPEFQQMLQTHYVSRTSDNENVTEQTSEPSEPSRFSQVYLNFTSLFSDIQLAQYLDFRGKKIGPIALELDFMKYLNTVPQFYNSTTKLLNLDNLKEYVWPYDSETKSPSEETVAYMTAIMDQATHLSHYKRPHKSSPVIYVVAEHDKYIPREFYHVTPEDVYTKEQTEVRVLDTGHVLAILQHQAEFRTAIKDAFLKLGCSF